MTALDEMIRFMDAEIRALKGRIGPAANAVQRSKLDMLSAIRRYLVERAREAA